jgi:hypothetical protein
MLEFIYTGNYCVSKAQITTPETREPWEIEKYGSLYGYQLPELHGRSYEGPLSTHVRLFGIACKYDIPALRDQAIAAYKAFITLKTIDGADLAKAVLIAFATGSDVECQMRDCVFNTLILHVKSQGYRHDLTAAIEKSDGLALRLIIALIDRLPSS